MIDLTKIKNKKQFKEWFENTFGKRSGIKFKPIYELFKMLKETRKNAN